MDDLVDRIRNHTHFLSRDSYQSNRNFWNEIIHLAVTNWPQKIEPEKISGSKRPAEDLDLMGQLLHEMGWTDENVVGDCS